MTIQLLSALRADRRGHAIFKLGSNNVKGMTILLIIGRSLDVFLRKRGMTIKKYALQKIGMTILFCLLSSTVYAELYLKMEIVFATKVLNILTQNITKLEELVKVVMDYIKNVLVHAGIYLM